MRSLPIIIFLVTVSGCFLELFGQGWQRQTIGSGLSRAATVHAGDIDGDDDPDVVATSFNDGKVVWYENDLPNSRWSVPQVIDDSLPGASSVQIADIDNDNHMDIVAAGNNVHDVVWYRNEGGNPVQWTKSIIDGGIFAQVVRVADIDNDEDADVIVTAIDGQQIYWYENDNLSWNRHPIGGFIDGAICLEVYDMDGDSDPDVVATSFLEFKVFWFENDSPNNNWYRHSIDTLFGPWGLGIADIDADEDPDIVVTSLISDDVIWYENSLPNSSWTKNVIDANLDGARYLSIVDVDSDTDPDIVASGYDADMVVLYQNNLLGSTWTKEILDSNLNGANYVHAADVNASGNPDLIVTGWFANKVVWYKNPMDCSLGILGDVGNDSLVNSTDALALLSFDVGLPIPQPIMNRINRGFGDVNSDGLTNSSDALITLSYDAGILVPFPIGNLVCLPGGNQSEGLTGTLPRIEGSISISAFPFQNTTLKDRIIDIPVVVDMSNTRERLGSYTVQLEWNPLAFEFVNCSGGTSTGFENPVINPSQIARGKLIAANANPYGADGEVNILNFELKAIGVQGASISPSVNFTAMSAANTFANLLPYLQTDGMIMAVERGEKLNNYQMANYPNPFNPSTNIEFSIPESEHVTLKIYNSLGQEIATIVSRKLAAGKYRYEWDASGFASGVYLYRIQTENYVESKKMILLR